MKKYLIGVFSLIIISATAQNPTNLDTSSVNSNSILLSWTNSGCGTFIKLRYKETGASGWSFIGSNSNQISSPYLLTGLTTNTSYDWGVKCNGTNGWSTGPSFITSLGCNISTTVSITDASCSNTLDGNVDLSVSGGANPYSYSWSNGITTQDLTNVLAGTYYVTVNDNVGCTINDTATVGFAGNKSATQNITAFVDTSTPNFPGVVTGYHKWAYDTLTIVNTGCDVNIRPEFIVSHQDSTISQGDFVLKWWNPILNLWANILYDIDANGDAYGFWNTASLDSTGIMLSIGSTQQMVIRTKFVNPANYGTYTASWETFEVDNLGNKIGSLAPADTVTLSLVNCSNFSIDTISTSHASCVGSNDGSANFSINNGSGSYLLSWSNGSTNSNTISNLTAGTYTITATDINWGCSDSITFTITQPDSLSAALNGTNISCFGLSDGALSVVASGESGVYAYDWNPTSISGTNPINLSIGTYTVTVIDLSCGTTTSRSYTITEPSILTANLDSSAKNTSCDTICNGMISINISGGTLPYSYSWSNGDSLSARYNLCADLYTIVTNDVNLCNSDTISLLIQDSTSAPSISLSAVNISCNGANDGQATASIGGGGSGNISTLSYCNSEPWFDDKCNIELVHLVGDVDSIYNNTSGLADMYEDYTNQYTSLTPGQSYSIDIIMGVYNNVPFSNSWFAGAKAFIDWNIDGDFDDTGEDIGTISNQVTANSPLNTITFTVPNQVTFGPSRLRIVSQYNNDAFGPCEVGGGATFSQPYYGATEDYSLVITGTIPANYAWSNGDTTSQITNLPAGTYVCTVTDTNGCSSIDSVTITEPTAISTIENISNVLCNGGNSGTVSLTISGGAAPYNTNWGSVDTNALIAGTYSYTITDSNGCIYNDSINLTEPLAISNIVTTTNVSCANGNDGSIDITLSGGITPYTFIWSNGDTTEDISAIYAGWYTVTITDANGCSLLDSINISEPNILTTSNTTTSVSCNGLSDGSTTININGGTVDYTISALNQTLTLVGGISTYSIAAIPAGNYPYTITDANNCTVTDTVTIVQPNPISTIANITNVLCNGGNSGTASLNIIGGTPSYNTNWGNIDTNALSAGIYNYMITDANGCSYTDSISITEPLPITSTFTTTDVACYGDSTGGATVIFNGGVTDYLLSWQNFTYPLINGTNIFITPVGVPAGVYPYGVTDANGCTHFDTITINQASLITANKNITDALCYGDSSGSVNLTITGGTAPYTEQWSGVNPSSLSAGTYIYTITDTNGCILTDSVSINEPNPLNTQMNVTNLSSCITFDGSVDLSVSGGVPPYSYLWNNGDTIEDINNLSAGIYIVNITDSNGCLITDTAYVTQPSNNLSLSLIESNYNGYNITCNGENNGQILANVSGGTGNITYLWSTNDTINVITNLSSGSYSITITDSIGCSLTDSTILDEPLPITSIFTTTDVTCYGDSTGSATVIFNGGVTDYLLSWQNFTYPLINGTNIFITPVGVPAGVYPYGVTDINGCTHFDTITINQADSLYTTLILSNYNGYNISCNGANDGSVEIHVNGGIYPYEIYYDNNLISTNDSIINIPFLTSGIYLDSIIDNNGCIFTEQIILSEPSPLSINLIGTHASCAFSCDGEIITQVTGGVIPYTYYLDTLNINDTLNGLCVGMYSISIVDNNGCVIIDSNFINQPSAIIINLDSIIDVSIYGGNDGEIYISSYGGSGNLNYNWTGPNNYTNTSNNIFNLTAGTYILEVTDSTGCNVTDTFYVTQPPSLTAELDSIIHLRCNSICNGEIFITPSGGDSIYSFFWVGPNGYTSISEDIDSLCAGIYTLFLSDTTYTLTFIFEVLEPTPITTIIASDSASCYGGNGSATVYMYGGIYPYEILWSNGSVNPTTVLPAGAHYVRVTDDNGCEAVDSVVIFEPDSLILSVTTIPISCYGLQDGEVTISISGGGIAPFEYSSNNGQTYQLNNTFYNLSPGSHSFIVKDINGCVNDIHVTLTQPQELIVTISTNDASCYGVCDGLANPNISGGNTPYTEDWLGFNPNSLCAGFYTMLVTDNNGCNTSTSFTINQPNPVTVNIWQQGSYLEADPGFVSYQWLDSQGAPIIGANSVLYTPLTSGEYSVMVTDINGCTGTSTSILFIMTGDSENNINLNIYPNPTSGKLYVESTRTLQRISILHINGSLVYEVMNPGQIKSPYLELDISKYSKGIYFIQIEIDNKLINERIILQ